MLCHGPSRLTKRCEESRTCATFRRYLIDVGCGDYHSGSMAWLFRVYAQRGILFDRVFGTLSDVPTAIAILPSVSAFPRVNLLLKLRS